MNKIILLILLFILVSCENSGGLGYKIENNKTIYRSWNEGHGFTIKTLNADSDSFVDIDGTWAKDHSNVFYLGNKIPKLRAESFVVLDKKFGKDNSNVYCAYTLLDSADVASFEVYNDEFMYSYGKDKNAAYLCSGHNGGFIRVSSKSIKKFRRVGKSFYADKENVYWLSDILIGVNPKTFKIINKNYVTDGIKVFYGRDEIIGADASTFEVLDVTFAKAKDKNYYYKFEKREKKFFF